MLFSSWLRDSYRFALCGVRADPNVPSPAPSFRPRPEVLENPLRSAAISRPIWWATSPALLISPIPT